MANNVSSAFNAPEAWMGQIGTKWEMEGKQTDNRKNPKNKKPLRLNYILETEFLVN